MSETVIELTRNMLHSNISKQHHYYIIFSFKITHCFSVKVIFFFQPESIDS